MMIALTLAAFTALHAGPLEEASPRLSPDAATAYRVAESRRDWGLGFKFLTAVGAVGVVSSGATAITFAIKAYVNSANYQLFAAYVDEGSRDLALAACGASAALMLVSGVVAFLFDVWAERLTREAAQTP